jgi:outer membrane receptor protein involved in Fe transport
MNKFRFALLLAMSVLLVAGSAFAQTPTTGAIVGTVAQAGAPLPGVTVEVKSPALQGVRTEVTDTKGQFRFSLLAPGDYTLTTTLSGFNTVTQKNIAVQLSRTVTLDVAMSPQVSEQITVTGAAPVVDVTSSATGTNVTSETMSQLPIARNFTSVAQVAPGTNTDATGTTFYGSTGAENQYVIDGLNTTEVRNGREGKTLNFDFVQEVEVKTGGLPAEYGRMTGGMINAITKSGGNEFSGGVFAFDQPRGLRADNATLTERPFTAGSTIDDKTQLDYGVDLGGYFVKDRLWFFGAYNRQDRTRTNTRINQDLVIGATPELPGGFSVRVGDEFDTKIKSNLFAGKLTLRATENQNLTVSLFGDPTTTSGPLFGVNGPLTTTVGERKTGGSDYIGRYTGIFATTFLVNAEAGHHHEDATITGAGTALPGFIDQTVSPNFQIGGFGFFDNNKYDRDVAKLGFTKYFSSHEVKVGGDYEKMKADVQNYQGGAGQRIYKRTKGGVIYYRHRYYVDDLAPGFNANDSSTWKIALPQIAKPETENYSMYAQDSWRVLPNFTVSAGVRWESQELFGRGDTPTSVKSISKINDNWAPRLGVIWDVANNGRSKAYANYGRFYENIPMDINIRSFGGELVCFCYNFSPSPAALAPDPKTTQARSSLLGGPTPVDPNLKGQYIDELLGGYEYEIAPNLAVGIKGTYRKLGRVIEDMLQVPITGAYTITNPSTGFGRETGFYNFEDTAAAPKAKRTYKGLELSANKRFSNNYQFFASYLWSRLEGNYDGTFQASTGQLDPNINSAYDYADFLVNNHGLLSNDRTHQLKFYGSYQLSGSSMMSGMTLGVGAHYASGTPLTAVGYSQGYQNWEYYLTTRGALGRGPADYEADFHIDYPVKVGAQRLSVIADVFNVLDRQGKTAVDQRFNRAQDDPCTGFESICDTASGGGGGVQTVKGTLTPIGKVDPSKAPNPDFLKAGTGFTSPRTFRLGARWTF